MHIKQYIPDMAKETCPRSPLGNAFLKHSLKQSHVCFCFGEDETSEIKIYLIKRQAQILYHHGDDANKRSCCVGYGEFVISNKANSSEGDENEKHLNKLCHDTRRAITISEG